MRRRRAALSDRPEQAPLKRRLTRLSAVSPYVCATVAALSTAALCEYVFGRPLICTCGYVKLWQGDVWSSENSQHLTDWYTFSHIIHGFALYYLTRLLRRFMPGLSLLHSFVLALMVEMSWEIVENSSFVVERYRATTISLDYVGDSIVNSQCDILAMVVGFMLAMRLSVKLILLLTLAMELGVGYVIRDNLTLNILMLIYEFPAVKRWQMGQ